MPTSRKPPPAQPEDRFGDASNTSDERPQKKRRLDESYVPGGQTNLGSSDGSQAPPPAPPPAPARQRSRDASNLPFPAPRTATSCLNRGLRRATQRQSLSNESIVYGAPNTPSEVTRYPVGLADLAHWQGTNVEDSLSEAWIRSGYSERITSNPAELNSSRPLVLSALKANGSVPALSAIMDSCRHLRQEKTTEVEQDGFKPPSRVTLTDTRREAWMKELANESIPIRRLSKTVPHGIRGRPLMDQCLLKTIPVWRAIWLIKCVGSNEMRAFQRRGGAYPNIQGSSAGGGGAQYIKEWTESVIESVAALALDPSGHAQTDVWRPKFEYMTSLTRKIYDERLVDRDLFQAGLIHHFRVTASPRAVVILLSLLIPYLPDILRYCHRSRQLLDAVLEKCLVLSRPGTDSLLGPIRRKCSAIVTTILRNSPESAILPGSWHTYYQLLAGEGTEQRQLPINLIDKLDFLNSLVDHATKLALDVRTPTPVAAVIALCDACTNDFKPRKLVAECSRLLPDPHLLAHTFVTWALSPCRLGLRPVYVAVRLLGALHGDGYDPQEQLLAFLDSADSMDSDRARRLYRLVTELVLSRDFSVSRFLQHRMAAGVSSTKKEHLELLSYLPPRAIPAEMVNLAANLCQQTGCPSVASPAEVEAVVTRFGTLFSKDTSNADFASAASAFLSPLTPNLRNALALYIRNHIVKHSRQDQPGATATCSAEECFLRAPAHNILVALELIDDLSLFAGVLLLIVPTCNVDSLRAVARCTTFHHEVLQAKGASEVVLRGIMARYAALHQQGTRDRDLILAVLDMMRMTVNAERPIAILQEHLSSIMSEIGGIAPSPVSDRVGDVSQSSEIHSINDLENFLQSGNVVDDAVTQRVLRHLFRLMMSGTRNTDQITDTLKVLACIKSLQKDAFAKVFDHWLEQVLQTDDARIAVQIVPWLVAGGLSSIVNLVNRASNRTTFINKKPVSAIGLSPYIFVSVLKPSGPEFLGSIEHYYSLRSAQQQFVREETVCLTRLINSVLEATKSNNESVARRAKQVSSSSVFDTLLLPTLCRSAVGNVDLERELERLEEHNVSLEPLLSRALKYSSSSAGIDYGQPQLLLIDRISRVADAMNAKPSWLLTREKLSEIQALLPPKRQPLLEQAAKIILSPNSAWLQLNPSWSSLLARVDKEFVAIVYRLASEQVITHVHTVESDDAEFDKDYCIQRLNLVEAAQHLLAEQENADGFKRAYGAFQEGMPKIENFGNVLADRRISPSSEKSLAVVTRLVLLHLRHPQEAAIPRESVSMFCFLLSRCLIAMSQAKRNPLVGGIDDGNSSSSSSTETILETALVFASSLLTPGMRTKCRDTLRLVGSGRSGGGISDEQQCPAKVDFILCRDDPGSGLGRYLLMTDHQPESLSPLSSASENDLSTPSTPGEAAVAEYSPVGGGGGSSGRLGHRTQAADSDAAGAIEKDANTAGTEENDGSNITTATASVQLEPYNVDPWDTFHGSSSASDACIDLALLGARRHVP